MELKETIDRPVAQLILDLEERGLLGRTLVVLASEFSRDALIEGRAGKEVKAQFEVNNRVNTAKQYGLHSHYTGAASVVMFGAGVKHGFVYGSTAEERPCEAVDKPVMIEDLHATIYKIMGIPADLAYEVEKRPFYVTRDGLGEPIEGVLA
jgi:hypothetical protein